MKIKELIAFNQAFSQTKVVALNKESSIKYFKLKIAVSEEVAKISAHEHVIKEQTKPDEIKDENNLTEQQFRSWKNAFEEVLIDYQDQILEKIPDTHILTQDEFYNSILSVDLNNGIDTEKKAIMMKYLIK